MWLLQWKWPAFALPIEWAAMVAFPKEMQPAELEGRLPW